MATLRDYPKLYSQIGRLLETAPDLSTNENLNAANAQQWFGRAHALIEAVGIGTDAVTLRTSSMPYLTSGSLWETGRDQIFTMLYRALATCELHSPAAAAGSFIPVGNSFDAFAALSKLLASARTDVMIVDPYMDETALTEFGLAVPSGVPLRLLSDQATYKATLGPAGSKWIVQHGPSRPLAVRLAPPKALHDRAIFADGTNAWTLTQSLKDFAKRSPAEIVRADDTASMKIAAYEEIWNTSTIVV